MVGFGYDVHKLEEGLPLYLGGVQISSPHGCVAHSDGDVLLHALMDALLGAAGMADIGEHFPDTDIQYKGADSKQLLAHVVSLINNQNLYIVNIDVTLVMEKPKISPYKLIMSETIANICGIEQKRVNIKATTNEKLGFIGRNEGAAAYAVCEIQYKS